jgi:hypothetical protein
MSTAMQEPAYILKNGQSVAYIPLEVKTARDAYAASLHVLFKHVADFHICIVKTFSAKYGIPEDDILKTIQESEEFKNMQVDPVLDMGMQSLGYLDEVPVAEVPVTTTDVPKITPSVTKTKTPPPVVESHVNLEETPAKITKIIRKKAVVPKPKPATDVEVEPASSVPTAPTSSVPTATKATSSVPTATKATSSVPTATKATSSVPLAYEGDVPRKIIKKKTNTTKPN